MALATQCPHCHTTFRVAHDQLKLRAGLVRCGACKQIFNGIENLVRSEETRPSAAPTPQPIPPADHQATPAAAPVEFTPPPAPTGVQPTPVAEKEREPESSHGAEEASIPADERPKDDPLLRMTLMDFAHARREPIENPDASAETEEDDSVEQAIDDLQGKPWRRKPDTGAGVEMDALDQVDAADYEEPAFVRQGRRRQRIGRMLRIVLSTASVILFVGLALQSIYVFRDQLAVTFPQTKPLLANACSYLGCQVGLPAQVDAVSIESSELQALTTDGNTFSLTVLLRNRSVTPQAWPNIELTLNDNDEKAIARRVFLPREYLPSGQDINTGLAARSEQPLKLYFELSQLKAAGYRVYVFYP